MAFIIRHVCTVFGERPVLLMLWGKTQCHHRTVTRRRAERSFTAGTVFGVDTWPKRGCGWDGVVFARGCVMMHGVATCDSIIRLARFFIRSARLIRRRSKAHRDSLERWSIAVPSVPAKVASGVSCVCCGSEFRVCHWWGPIGIMCT